MSKNILALLFESRAKIKLLKYIYQHQDEIFTVKHIASKVQESKDDVSLEIEKLLEIGIIKKASKPNKDITHEEI